MDQPNIANIKIQYNDEELTISELCARLQTAEKLVENAILAENPD